MAAETLPEVLVKRGLPAALSVLESVRQQILKAIKELGKNQAAILNRARIILARHEPILARILRDSLLTAWLTGAKEIGQQASIPMAGGPMRTPPPNMDSGLGGEPVVRFPQIETASKWLADREAILPSEFNLLDQDARRAAFTISRVQSLESIRRIQDLLRKDLEKGGTLKEFQRDVAAELEGALSPWEMENLYRTENAKAMAAGQKAILDNPFVSDEFPFVEYTATHDSRTRPEHLAMERHGIQGTAIYWRDDPVIQKFWPPWGYSCRCWTIPLTVEDAAAKGILIAQEWIRTGVRPTPVFVRMPPFDLPKGWASVGNRIQATAI